MIRAITTSLILATASPLGAAPGDPSSPPKLEARGVEIERTRFQGHEAVRLRHRGEPGFAMVEGARLRDGELEVEVAGTIDPEAWPLTRMFARGFIGLAFRVRGDLSAYEKVYLRPANARVDDQLRRNHTTQYASHPDHPWKRLRKESPGRYESYVDLRLGVWTKMRILVEDDSARLYVDDAAQPCLVVSDLKLTPEAGGVALWVGPGTAGYFRNLRIRPLPGSDS